MTGGPYCYLYDSNGFRVAKKSGASSCSTGTVTKIYWRSITGATLAETDSTGSTTNSSYNEYIFFSGRRIASRNGTGSIFYYFADQVGNTRTITTGNGPGQTPGQLCYDADFTPYGQEMQHTERLQTVACPPNYKFTGYERDSETGLDYAFARYYSPLLGRFLSADPLGGVIGRLQSHNAYSYTLNNPLNATDPSGQFTCPPGYSSVCNQIAHNYSGFGLNSWGVLSDAWDALAILAFAFTPTSTETVPNPACSDGDCQPGTPDFVTYITYGNINALYLLFELDQTTIPLKSKTGHTVTPNQNLTPEQASCVFNEIAYADRASTDAIDDARKGIGTTVLSGMGAGAVTGFYGGFSAGEVFGGDFTLGASGIIGGLAGAGLGAGIGGVVGLQNGMRNYVTTYLQNAPLSLVPAAFSTFDTNLQDNAQQNCGVSVTAK